MSEVVLMHARSVAQAIPNRFWLPPGEQLDALAAGRASVKAETVELEADGGAGLTRMRPVWIAVERADAHDFSGQVRASSVDRDGYRKGDGLTIGREQVFDLVRTDESGNPALNQPFDPPFESPWRYSSATQT